MNRGRRGPPASPLGSRPEAQPRGVAARGVDPAPGGWQGLSIISTQDLTRVFGAAGDGAGVMAVNGLNLDIFPGEFLSVTGRSGSGKTTLLNLMGRP